MEQGQRGKGREPDGLWDHALVTTQRTHARQTGTAASAGHGAEQGADAVRGTGMVLAAAGADANAIDGALGRKKETTTCQVAIEQDRAEKDR